MTKARRLPKPKGHRRTTTDNASSWSGHSQLVSQTRDLVISCQTSYIIQPEPRHPRTQFLLVLQTQNVLDNFNREYYRVAD